MSIPPNVKRALLGIAGGPWTIPDVSIVQYALHTISGSDISLALPSTPTPGNAILVCIGEGGHPSAGDPYLAGHTGLNLTQYGSRGRAHATNGSCCWLYYRVVIAGDGTTVTVPLSATTMDGFIVEIAGLALTGPSASYVANDNGGTSAALAMAPGSAFMDFAAVITDMLTFPAGGALAPNSDSVQINGIDFAAVVGGGASGLALVYGRGSVTLGGTLSGGGVANWGMTGLAWPLRTIL